MVKITMKSWNYGMQKVSLSKLQVELLGMSLRESKNNVDVLLNGDPVVIEIENDFVGNDFFEKAAKIGVNCSIEIV